MQLKILRFSVFLPENILIVNNFELELKFRFIGEYYFCMFEMHIC